MRIIILVGLAMLISGSAWADVITTTSGNKIECVIIQENKDSIVVRRAYGTMTLPRSMIGSVTKSPVLTDSSIALTTQPTPGQRVPGWNDVLAHLVKAKWATNVQQIPATVIDVGAMKSVPYKSYQCGQDYEVNIYGDPDHPAAVEIGIYRTLLNSSEAKKNCVEFMASIMPDKTDAAIVRALNQAKDLVVRDEWTTEITPATAPDAYGGWWVSVYSEKQLDGARASDVELKQITVAKYSIPPKQVVPTPTVSMVPQQTVTGSSSDDDWTPADMARARSISPTGPKDVYVRGYYRSNGTYVNSYTRSSPHR